MEELREVRHLGRGAFGEVVLAERLSDGRLVAVKHIRRAEMAEGEVLAHRAEVRALQALQHPCILRYFASTEDRQALHIVTEYADAGDLQQLLKSQIESGKPFEVLMLLAMLAQLSSALAHVHSKRVMHRDLKPANVFLTTQGLLKLGDFGVAKVLAGTTVMDQMTCVGSPTYMAPEIVGGELYGPACDVWSLGVVLYELCTFKKPFEGRSLGELVMRVSSGAYKSIADVVDGAAGGILSAGLAPLVDMMLVVEVKERATAAEVMRSPVLQLFVASMRSCRACLEPVFLARGGGEGTAADGGGELSRTARATEAELDLAGATALEAASASASASRTRNSRGASRLRVPGQTESNAGATSDLRSVPGSKMTGGARGAEVLSFSQSAETLALSAADTLALSVTSAFGNSLEGAGLGDTEVSFALTEGTVDALGAATLGLGEFTSARTSTDGSTLQQGSFSTKAVSGAHPKFHGSIDKAYMREMLGDILEAPGASGPAGDDSSSDGDLREAALQAAYAGIGASPSSPPKKRKPAERRRFADTLEAVTYAQEKSGSENLSTTMMMSSKPSSQGATRGQAVSLIPGLVNPHWEVAASTASGGGANAARRLGGSNSTTTSRGSTPSGAGANAPLARAAQSVVGTASPSGAIWADDHDKSVTWPPREAALAPASANAARGGQRGQRKVDMRATTPPAGRPTTPESARRRKAEDEYLREAQRKGAMTIPFFDRKPGEPMPLPPERFREAVTTHDQRQKRRSLERNEKFAGEARKPTPEKVRSRGPQASASAPSLRSPGPSNGSPGPRAGSKRQ